MVEVSLYQGLLRPQPISFDLSREGVVEISLNQGNFHVLEEKRKGKRKGVRRGKGGRKGNCNGRVNGREGKEQKEGERKR